MAKSNLKPVPVFYTGRRRKPGKRFPCGKLEQKEKIDPKVIAFTQPHRRVIQEKDRHDPKAECYLGRYQLMGLIGIEEYGAGAWYRGVVNRYRAILDVPAAPGSQIGKLGAIGGKSLAVDDDDAIRRKSVYDRAFEAAQGPGQRAAKWVARVAVHDEACPAEYFGWLRLGLVALAAHNGLLTAKNALDRGEQIRYKYFRNIR